MRGVVGRHDMSSCAAMSRRLRGGAALVIAFLVVSVFDRPASAETLEEALADAYLINPVLNAERARLRAIDEQVALAKSGLRPFIFGSADTAFLNTNTGIDRPRRQSSPFSVLATPGACDNAVRSELLPANPGSVAAVPVDEIFGGGEAGTDDGLTNPRGYAINLTQPLFQGFQNLNAIRQAKATVQAAREVLRTSSRPSCSMPSTAYVNVVRDRAIVRLRENDVTVLSEQLKATKDRFDVGEVTRTDVAQAEARRSEALATLAAAQANLKTSRAAYEQIIGHPPGNLVTPPSIRHLLPADPQRGDDARRRRESHHPRHRSTTRSPRSTPCSRSWARCSPR